MNWTARIITILAALILCAVAAHAQEEPKVCISQKAANECAKAVVEAKDYKDLSEALRKGREEDAKIIDDLKIKLAMETQKSISLEAQINYQMKIIDFLLTNGRKKIKIGLINF